MKAARISWFYITVYLLFLIIPGYFLQEHSLECPSTRCKLDGSSTICGISCVCTEDPSRQGDPTEGVCGVISGDDYYYYPDSPQQPNTGAAPERYPGSSSPQTQQTNVAGPAGPYPGSTSPQSYPTNAGGTPSAYPGDYVPQAQQTYPAMVPGGYQGTYPSIAQQQYASSTYGQYPSYYGSSYGRAPGAGNLALIGVQSVISNGLQAFQLRQMMHDSTQYQTPLSVAPPAMVTPQLPSEIEAAPIPPERTSSLSPTPPRRQPPPIPERSTSSVSRRPAPQPPSKGNAPSRPPPPPPPPKGSPSPIKKLPPTPPRRVSSLPTYPRPALPPKPVLKRPLPARPSSRPIRTRITWPWKRKG